MSKSKPFTVIKTATQRNAVIDDIEYYGITAKGMRKYCTHIMFTHQNELPIDWQVKIMSMDPADLDEFFIDQFAYKTEVVSYDEILDRHDNVRMTPGTARHQLAVDSSKLF